MFDRYRHGFDSCALVPYCPIPINSGGKAEMWRSLQALRELGSCRVVSARAKPVGAGWKPEAIEKFRADGFDLRLREDYRRRSATQQMGIAYAALFKVLGMEKAFGHSNPYHRHAFPVDWWRECVEGCDVAIIHYSYWARLPCPVARWSISSNCGRTTCGKGLGERSRSFPPRTWFWSSQKTRSAGSTNWV